jgi:hypothetical protein
VVSTQAPVSGAPPAVGSTLGTFELVEQVGSWGGQARFRARGRDGTANAGAEALLVARPLSAAERSNPEPMLTRLQRLAALRHELIAPVFEVGGWEGGVFLAHSWPGSETLAGRLGQDGALPLPRVLPLLDGLAGALDAAAGVGAIHGDVRLANVWRRRDGRPILGGFSLVPIAGASPAADAAGLAAVAASLLAGKPIAVASPGAEVPPEQRWDPFGLPEVVRMALARGFGPDLAARYASAGALAGTIQDSVASAAAIQVAGAWEALERRDYPMAQMLSDAAHALRPDDLQIAKLVLHVRTFSVGSAAISPFDFDAPARLDLDGVALERPGGQVVMPSASAYEIPGLKDLPPELAAILAPPIPTTSKSAQNPWAMMGVGLAFLFVMTIIVAMLAMSSA